MKTKGLTLKEALESGKPFRRNSDSIWATADISIEESWITSAVLANDFELKVELREWTVKVTPSGSMVVDPIMNCENWEIINVREVLE